jgi:hypothetical protein
MTTELIARVRLYCDVAKANGSLLSISELLSLLPEHGSEDELERAIRSNPDLNTAYELKSGFIVERSDLGSGAEARERASRLKARLNLAQAERIVPFLKSPQTLLIGVSGSTSYKSASKSDDVDFFCVTKKGTLWVFLTRALILSRVMRHLWAEAPDVCLSCTLDAENAERSFASSGDSLVARDALSMIVAFGKGYYEGLLRKGQWISDFYPKLYASRLGADSNSETRTVEPTLAQRVVNRFLYLTVGTYVKVKSRIHNGRLARQGRYDSVFTLLMGENRCVYESARYSKMRSMYGSLKVK